MAIVCSDVLINNFEILKEGLDKTCFKSNENTIILMQILSSLFLADCENDSYNEKIIII